MRTKYELAHVINRFGTKLSAQTNLTPLQQKVLGKIALCRTAALGGHEEVCESCGTIRYSYNSCGDRHCPSPRRILQVIFKPVSNIDFSIARFKIFFSSCCILLIKATFPVYQDKRCSVFS